MNFFRRAYKYCFRKKGKSLILLLVLTCISSFVVMSLGIMASINQELDFDTAFLVASEFGVTANKKETVM